MPVVVDGLDDLLKAMKGPTFRQVNRQLRRDAKQIADRLLPGVQAAVRTSAAPQADKVAAASRAISDRKPTIVIGRNRPGISGFKRPGGNTKSARMQVAHGVVFGPAGGRRDTRPHENYYRIARQANGGSVQAYLRTQSLHDAEVAYLRAFMALLRDAGFVTEG